VWKIAKPAMFGLGLLLAGAAGAQAQTAYYPAPYWQNPAYGYPYGYSTYGNPHGWLYRTYLGFPYPAPLAFWDPYVWYRPYSDNAGPKASGQGGF
jgi:hypothetical protein